MALEAYQRALALVATDSRARAQLRDSPDAMARALGLDAREIASLVGIDRRRLDLFADQLRLKRFAEVRQQLSRTAAALGDDELRNRFDVFAESFLPEGINKHRADALAFADHLTDVLGGDAREAAAIDRATLGLFYRRRGRIAIARSGPCVAHVRMGSRRVLLVRPRGALRYRTLRLF